MVDAFTLFEYGILFVRRRRHHSDDLIDLFVQLQMIRVRAQSQHVCRNALVERAYPRQFVGVGRRERRRWEIDARARHSLFDAFTISTRQAQEIEKGPIRRRRLPSAKLDSDGYIV